MIVIPGPRAHLAGTLDLIACFARLCGGHAQFAEVRALIDRPEALPDEVSTEEMALKYDAYLTRSATRSAWGVTVNDRWETVRLRTRVEDLASAWGLDLEPYRRLRERVAERATPVLTASFGFDAPREKPRLKLYLQEEPWNAGLCTRAELEPVLEEIAPGCVFPDWVPDDARIGVVTLELHPGGARSLKAYLGAESPAAAVAGAPAPVASLARQMEAASPLGEGWYYLTIRMAPDASHRYAVNKIYNQVQLGFRDGGTSLDAAWADVAQLFGSAGRAQVMSELRDELSKLDGLRVVPTASAIEDGGSSADLYCAAWRL